MSAVEQIFHQGQTTRDREITSFSILKTLHALPFYASGYVGNHDTKFWQVFFLTQSLICSSSNKYVDRD